jgi:hypothetical protein
MSAFGGKADIAPKLFTKDEARRIAASIAKLSSFLQDAKLTPSTWGGISSCKRRQKSFWRFAQLVQWQLAHSHLPTLNIIHRKATAPFPYRGTTAPPASVTTII